MIGGWRAFVVVVTSMTRASTIGPGMACHPELITARRLLRDVARLEDAVADYRRVVVEMLHDAPDDDDLSF